MIGVWTTDERAEMGRHRLQLLPLRSSFSSPFLFRFLDVVDLWLLGACRCIVVSVKYSSLCLVPPIQRGDVSGLVGVCMQLEM